MGGCCSCLTGDPQNIYEDNETNDKSNLLNNPVGETSRNSNYNSINHRVQTPTEKIDEQAKLNRILQDTAKSYIDVPALNSPMEQPNYSAWEKDYGDKIREVLSHRHYDGTPIPLLTEVPYYESLLAGTPLPEHDRNMMSELSKQVVLATGDFKVNYTDSLIIPFNIPK